MSSQLAIEQTISSFQALHERLNLCRTSEASFFPEWQTPTMELAESEKAFLDHLRQRYYNYYNAGLLTEGTVLLLIVAPLLERLGFHEPPFLSNLKFPLALR